MSRSNRKALLLAAVAGMSLFAGSEAQTWVNPTVGNWNVAANWNPVGVPASANTTALYFNATGSQSYVATNDLLTFTLNSLNFNNSGTGVVNLAGDLLSFAGAAPAIVQNGAGAVVVGNAIELAANTTVSGTGAGTLTLSGALSSNPAPDGTTGNRLIKTSTGRLELSGGGNIFQLDQQAGTTSITGGNLSLSSLQYSSILVPVSADAALLVGSVPGTTTFNMSNGAQVSGNDLELGPVAGANVTSAIDGSSTTLRGGRIVLGRGGSPATSTVNVAVTNGARIEANFNASITGSTGLISVASGPNVDATLSILSNSTLFSDGAVLVSAPTGSVASTNGTLLVSGSNATAYMPDAQLITTTGEDFGLPGGNSTISIDSGASMSAGFARLAETLGNATILVNNGHLAVNGNVTNGFFELGTDDGSQATVKILNGGTVTNNARIALGAYGSAAGTFTIDGPGSSLDNGSGVVFTVGGGYYTGVSNGTGYFAVTNGGTASLSLFGPGWRENAQGNVLIDGADTAVSAVDTFITSDTNAVSTFTVSNGATFLTGNLVMSGGNAAGYVTGTSTLNINSGGVVTSATAFISDNIGTSTINVTGDLSQLQMDSGTTAFLLLGNDGTNSIATANVSAGGSIVCFDGADPNTPLSGAVFVGPTPGSVGTVNMSGADSFIAADQLLISGEGTTANVGGRGVYNQTDGTTLVAVGVVYSSGTYNMNGGTYDALLTAVDGRMDFSGGIVLAGDLEVAGNVVMTTGNNKTLQTTDILIQPTGKIDLADNGMTVNHEAGTLGVAGNVRTAIKNARNTGAWDGASGITSSVAAANPAKFGVGYAQVGIGSNALNITSFRGISVDDTSVVARETYNGDADLDGDVDSIDFNRLLTGYGLTAGGEWANGDFNYDDKVNTTDFNYVAGNFGSTPLGAPVAGPILEGGNELDFIRILRTNPQLAESMRSSLSGIKDSINGLELLHSSDMRSGQVGGVGSVVPEPASLSVLAIASLGLAARRRRA